MSDKNSENNSEKEKTIPYEFPPRENGVDTEPVVDVYINDADVEVECDK